MIRATLPLVVLAFAAAGSAQPATLTDEPVESRAAHYSFVRPGEITVSVMVLGDVRSPGYYTVGLGTTPDRLLALAGGALEGVQDDETTVTSTVQLLRPREDGTRRTLFTRSLEDLMTAASPPVDDDDLLLVEIVTEAPETPFVDTALRVTSALGTLFLIVYNVFLN